MKVLKRIAPLQLGKILAFIYLIIYVPMFALMSGSQYLNEDTEDMLGISAWFVVSLVLPIVGFLIGWIGAWAYNISAKLLGGIRYEVEELEQKKKGSQEDSQGLDVISEKSRKGSQ